MKKTILSSILAVSFLLTGCTDDYQDDYTKTYDKLLDETLGEWEVIGEHEIEVIDKPFYVSEDKYDRWVFRYGSLEEKPFHVPTYTYMKWRLEYSDTYGEKYTFDMYNMMPIEEVLIDGAFKKLDDQFNKKESKGIYYTMEDLYIRFGVLKDDDFTEQYKDIQKLYGETLDIKNLQIENAFKGKPTFVRVHFDYEEMDMSETQFEQFTNKEIEKLVQEIPYLNAEIRIESKNEDVERFFIQGKEVKPEKKYTRYDVVLKEYFPEYKILKHKE